MATLNRRDFVKSTAALAAAGGFFVNPSAKAQAAGKDGVVRVAAIGFRSRGRHLIDAVKRCKNAKLVAICDVDAHILADYDKNNDELFRTQDMREIFERDDVDAVISATPNHWHALVTIWACQAGKHVYIEKPISHDMLEGEVLKKVARKTNRIVQCGFQNRSDAALLPFFEDLHNGKFGQVTHVHGTCYRPRDPIGKLDKPLVVPDHINYDLWLGPAADEPIMRPRLHYDWHWIYNTGNGDVGNQGPHEWDMMSWAIGDPKELPTTIQVAGNRFGWDDAGTTPNVMACFGEMAGVPFRFEVMDLKAGRAAPYRTGVGVIIHTEQGVFVGGRGGGRFVKAQGGIENYGVGRSGQQGGDGGQSHMQNFIDAVLSSDNSNLRCEAETAVHSSNLPHMANIAFRLADKAPAEAVEKAFSGSVPNRDMIGRLRESVIDFAVKKEGKMPSDEWLLGPALTFDSNKFAFAGNKAKDANALMARASRRPGFELPKI